MLTIPNRHLARFCDGSSRREFMKIGSLGLFGLTLQDVLRLQDQAKAAPETNRFAGSTGFGSAKSVIVLFLQGGPSHIDIWDPKPDAPSNVRGEFKPIKSKIPGIELSETMPMLADAVDKCTLIRSMSYTPAGLFNHTAAIYQMLTGYEPTEVSPSGQLEPPSPNDFPTAGSWITKFRPPSEPVLPFVELPRPLQESSVIGKGGAAGFIGKAYDPYRLYQDPNKPIQLDDLELRKEVPANRLQGRFELLRGINESMPALEKAVDHYALDKYYQNAFDLVLSGKARNAFDLSLESDEMRDRYGRFTFGQGALMARRLVQAGTRMVQLNWPSVANGNPETTAWDTHASNFGPLRDLHCPKLDRTLATLLTDMEEQELLDETLIVAVGEFGRSPRLGVSTSGNTNSPDGRDHWPYCYTAMVAGAGIPGGRLYGESDSTASSPKEKPVHPNDLLATIYYALGIEPNQEIHNHLDQPRDLVKGKPLMDLWVG